MKKLSVVTPCYNEKENVGPLYEAIRGVLSRFPQYDYEHIYIDNASTDGTQKILRELAGADKRVKVILNSRNFGHIRSPFYGLTQATGEGVVYMASDFQDPPDMIPQFIEMWEQGYKTVVGVKNQSEETPLFFLIRRCFYKVIHALADTELIENFTGFGLYDKAIVDYCRKIEDPYPYFRGLIAEIGFEIAKVNFVQPRRKRGITKNNFYTLYDMAMLGFTSHSKVPLRLATMFGFLASVLSFLLGLGYLVYKLLFWYRFSVGMAPIAIGLFFFASVQLFFIGILGEYIGSIHTKVLNRPLVVEKERINF